MNTWFGFASIRREDGLDLDGAASMELDFTMTGTGI
jgi:hypothetical protein